MDYVRCVGICEVRGKKRVEMAKVIDRKTFTARMQLIGCLCCFVLLMSFIAAATAAAADTKDFGKSRRKNVTF